MYIGNPAENQTPAHLNPMGRTKIVITQQYSPATLIKLSFPQVIIWRIFKTVVL